MRSTHTPNLCPCCSKKLYKDCCSPLHQGKIAENALQLMRSRYSAYALGKVDYIIATTHPKNPTFTSQRKESEESIRHFCETVHFEKLEIVSFVEGDPFAYVTFIAHLSREGKDVSFSERSRFEKIGDRWLYLDGEICSKSNPKPL